MDQFWAAPPVSRTLVAVTAVQSILVHGGLLGFEHVVFYLPYVFKFPPHFWRVLTPFFLTGGGIGMLFDLYFLWTYSNVLETQSSRFSQPGDYATYLLFVATIILSTCGFVLQGHIFTPALVLALAYTFAQDNRGRKVTFIIFQIPAQYLPYAMLAASLVMGGPSYAMREATGLIAAHLYDFLTRLYPTFQGGKNYIQTPSVIRNAFGGNNAGIQNRAYGTAFRPAAASQGQTAGGGSSTGSSWGNTFGGPWRNRGTGRRLGGD